MSNQTTNQPNIDPALRDHLTELAELAREIGAVSVHVVRGARGARLVYDLAHPEIDEAMDALRQMMDKLPPGISLSFTKDVHLAIDDPAGVLVVLRFPASDGGESGVEVK